MNLKFGNGRKMIIKKLMLVGLFIIIGTLFSSQEVLVFNDLIRKDFSINGTKKDLILLLVSTSSKQSFGRYISPKDWSKCDGGEIIRTVYAELFTLLVGTKIGVEDEATTIKVANLRG